MTQRHASLDAWMHTLPPVPNIPGARGHSRRAHHHRHHPVAGAFVGMLMLSAWLLLLELWALEVTAWAALWACYGCRWAYRRNLVGRAVAVFRGRRTVSASHDAYRMAPLPASLAADPYDTERSRTRS